MVKDMSTDDQKKGRARTKAFKRLREEYFVRWQDLLVEEMKAEGIDYTPPKTKEQKAAEEALHALSAIKPEITLADVFMFLEAKASVALSHEPVPVTPEPEEDNAEFEKNDYADAQ